MLPYDPPHAPQPCEYLLAGWIMGGIQIGMTMREAGAPDDIFCHYYLVLNDVINCPPMFVGEGFLCVNVEYN